MNLQKISDENILDTTNTENIEKYKYNLGQVINHVKELGYIDNFVSIRGDDFFPNDFEWKPNSEYTNGEFRHLVTIAQKQQQPKQGFLSNLFRKKQQETSINDIKYEKFDLFYPTEFRSTKHFTVNTSLGLTGEYNKVSLSRKFTIIDDLSNFLNSGYAYSLSERDAYLDVTHESLKISKNAVILISIDTYNEIKDNEELMNQISQRRLVIYKGDINVAINMLLTENGILPFRTEYSYDDEIKEIISKSMYSLCEKYNLEYGRAHGMGGHFTSYIDQFDYSSAKLLDEFINYINNYVGEIIITNEALKSGKITWKECIESLGIDVFRNIIDEFNKMKQQELLYKKEGYDEDRKKITPEISNLFRETFKIIKENEDKINFVNIDNPITKAVTNFYISPDINSQVKAALEIRQYFVEYENENNKQH